MSTNTKTDAVVPAKRTIIATFYKQEWGGRKGDQAIDCGEESFDATNAVLLLDHDVLIELEDNSEQSDEIGRSQVPWDGPCSVHIQDSVCAFFGVDAVEEITREMLEVARAEFQPVPPEDVTVTMTIKVKLRKAPEVDVTSFIENLDYSIKSNTAGAVVIDTELVEAD